MIKTINLTRPNGEKIKYSDYIAFGFECDSMLTTAINVSISQMQRAVDEMIRQIERCKKEVQGLE